MSRIDRTGDRESVSSEEALRAPRYPISRWYVRPAAAWLAEVLAPTGVRPVHLTACGLMAAGAGAAVLCRWPDMTIAAAGLVLLAWLFDRADGLLARRQGTASAWGAWLDANIDEVVDVGLHAAVAYAAASRTGSWLPWALLIAFLSGKYLFMHGLATERSPEESGERAGAASVLSRRNRQVSRRNPEPPSTGARWLPKTLRRLYHLPGNADIRVHLLVGALLLGCLTAELAVVAAYYHLRWIVRYGLVARRLGGVQ